MVNLITKEEYDSCEIKESHFIHNKNEITSILINLICEPRTIYLKGNGFYSKLTPTSAFVSIKSNNLNPKFVISTLKDEIVHSKISEDIIPIMKFEKIVRGYGETREYLKYGSKVNKKIINYNYDLTIDNPAMIFIFKNEYYHGISREELRNIPNKFIIEPYGYDTLIIYTNLDIEDSILYILGRYLINKYFIKLS